MCIIWQACADHAHYSTSNFCQGGQLWVVDESTHVWLSQLVTVIYGQSHSRQPESLSLVGVPGRTRFFKISVPVAVALMRHTLAASSADCPWSPQSLQLYISL